MLDGFAPSFWETDAQGNLVKIKRDSNLAGALPPERSLNDGWLSRVHPDDQGPAFDDWGTTVARGGSLDAECRFEDGKGGYRWMNLRAVPEFNRDGSLLRYVGMSIDIDERKRVEQALKDSEARALMLLEGFAPIYWETDAQGSVTIIRKSWADDTDRFYESMLGEGWLSIIHPEDRDRVHTNWKRAVAARSPVNSQCRIQDEMGNYRWLNLRAIPQLTGDGVLLKYVGMSIDITDQKLAEQTLKDSELRSRMLLEGFSPIYWETDRTGSAIVIRQHWNDANDETYADRLGAGWVKSIHPDDREEVVRKWTEILAAGDKLNVEFRVADETGVYKWWNLRASPQFASDGSLLKYVGMSIDIDARKRAELALVESEGRSRQLLEGFSPIFWEFNPEGLVVEESPTWAAYTGRPGGQLGHGWLASVHPEDQAKAQTTQREALARLLPFNIEVRLRNAAGEYRWMDVRAAPLLKSNGSLFKYVGMNIDVHARKSAEQALVESETRARLLLEGFSPVIWEVDRDGQPVGDFTAWLNLTGQTEEDLRREGWVAALHPDDREAALQKQIEGITARTPIEAEYRIRDASGAYRWSYERAAPVFNEDGSLLKYVGMNIDIHTRKSAELALIESAARSRLLLEGFGPVFWELSDSGFVYEDGPASNHFAARFGDTGRGLSRLDDSHPDDRALLLAAYQTSLSDRKPINFEARFRTLSGEYRWINVRAAPLFKSDGSFSKYVGMSIDIHARKNAEQLYRESVRRSQQFSDASSDVLWLRGADTQIFETVSRAFETIFGLPTTEIMSAAGPRRWASLIVPEDRPAALHALEIVRRGESTTHEYRIRRPSDGEFRWIRSTDFPICDDSGKVLCVAGISSDITDTRLLTERQAVLLAELQHRVRNIVAIVLSMTARTARSAKSVADYAELLHGRLSAIARTQSLLTRGTTEGVDLRLILQEEIAAQSAPDARYEIKGPRIALPPKAAEVMTLAVHELTTNALKHGALAARDGHVAVKWRVETREGQAWLVFEWREECAATLGDGQPARRGFGSELIARRVPYELRGSGTLDITPSGALCHLEFPIESAPSLLETDAPPPVAPYRGVLNATHEPNLAGVKVLVVEDDFLLANDIELALRSAGAIVVGPAADAETALGLIAADEAQVALLDLDLSGHSSLNLAAQLSFHGVPIVVVSGYDEARIPEALKNTPRLEKPADLRLVMRALADQAAGLRLH